MFPLEKQTVSIIYTIEEQFDNQSFKSEYALSKAMISSYHV